MRRTDKRPVRAATLAAVAGVVLALGLPIGWPHVGAASGRWFWNDIPGRSAHASGTAGVGNPGSGGNANPNRKLLPTVIPPHGTVIAPQHPVTTVNASGRCYFEIAPGGVPARWDPATPIPFIVRRPAGPPNGLEMVESALQQISNASGYRFMYEGLTDSIPSFKNPNADLGHLWIGWAFDDEVPELKDAGSFDTHTLGVGGPETETDQAGHTTIVGGAAVLRADLDLPNTFGPGDTMGNVLLHEILHTMNLAHVPDPTSVMSPTLSDTTRNGLGPLVIHELQSLDRGEPCQ